MRDILVGTAVDSANTDILQKRSKAASALLKQIERFDEGVFRLGGLIIVKASIDGKTQVYMETLSPLLAKKLDEEPLLLKQPAKLFSLLKDGAL